MSAIFDEQYITVDEAAKALKVSKSTVWRWIDQRQLPAYRVGQRRVRIKSSEVARLITPARQGQEKGGAMVETQQARQRLSHPLTTEEKKRALAALDAAEKLEKQLLAGHGVKQFSPASSDLLNEVRDERTRQLA